MDVIEQAKKNQYKIIEDFKKDPYNLKVHLPEVEKWANKLLKKFPKADKEVVLLSVWLHDAGHYVGNLKIDHAIKSEKIAKKFLKNKVSDDLLEKVVRVVRAHRGRDVMPKTLEEKLFACCDSSSHMTSYDYITIFQDGRFKYGEAKMNRDFRDVSVFPEVKKELMPIFKAWQKLEKEYKKLKIVKVNPKIIGKLL
jgi:hypothetical protein